ncbi:Hypothetical predicted protein [Octopus vulgaris]|uniref:Uncharacterized protein n=1 Tax=Octopus vulgaris TaxID=6645 RepID=A0AA36AMB3_OCTVU|nr:Hypothetical predicted protein [Octopus vulgaris]
MLQARRCDIVISDKVAYSATLVDRVDMEVRCGVLYVCEHLINEFICKIIVKLTNLPTKRVVLLRVNLKATFYEHLMRCKSSYGFILTNTEKYKIGLTCGT